MLWDEPKIFFLERRYFFSIILSEFLKNRVALQTLLPDTFNNEIIAHSVSPIAGDNKPHYQKMKADAEAGDPEAIRRYEATLAKRRDEYHKKKSRQEEVPA